jgi:hypothetical protein
MRFRLMILGILLPAILIFGCSNGSSQQGLKECPEQPPEEGTPCVEPLGCTYNELGLCSVMCCYMDHPDCCPMDYLKCYCSKGSFRCNWAVHECYEPWQYEEKTQDHEDGGESPDGQHKDED